VAGSEASVLSHKTGDNRSLRNVSAYLPSYTVSYPDIYSHREGTSETRGAGANITLWRNRRIRVLWSRDSSVGIATGYGLDALGLIPCNARFHSSPQPPHRIWGPPSLLSNVYLGIFSRIWNAGAWSWPLTFIWFRRQERWSYISTPPYVFMA
jgi:hypothetical protein